MSNADNVREYNKRKREAGFVRVDCLLTPEAYRVLKENSFGWETYGQTMSKILEEFGTWEYEGNTSSAMSRS